MPWPRNLNGESNIVLVRTEPSVPELQRALDAAGFLRPLTLASDRPVDVSSDDPPERLWRGRLGHKAASFRIGTAQPVRLPGKTPPGPDVLAWPLALWTTKAGDPQDVAAGAMALAAWAMATGGAAYYWEIGAWADLAPSKRFADFALTNALDTWTEFQKRYPDFKFWTGPKPGEKMEVEVRVH